MFKCQRKSVAEALADGTYGDWEPTAEQRAMLEAIFPDGVCDYTKPDAGLPVRRGAGDPWPVSTPVVPRSHPLVPLVLLVVLVALRLRFFSIVGRAVRLLRLVGVEDEGFLVAPFGSYCVVVSGMRAYCSRNAYGQFGCSWQTGRVQGFWPPRA